MMYITFTARQIQATMTTLIVSRSTAPVSHQADGRLCA